MEPLTTREIIDDGASWERHVRKATSPAMGCALDLRVETAQMFSGFSSFADAEGKHDEYIGFVYMHSDFRCACPLAELRGVLPPESLARVLALCERHGVRDAFQAR